MYKTMPVTEDQLESLERLLASHYVEQDLPEDLYLIVVRELKRVNKWFPDPQRHYHPDMGYLD